MPVTNDIVQFRSTTVVPVTPSVYCSTDCGPVESRAGRLSNGKVGEPAHTTRRQTKPDTDDVVLTMRPLAVAMTSRLYPSGTNDPMLDAVSLCFVVFALVPVAIDSE